MPLPTRTLATIQSWARAFSRVSFIGANGTSLPMGTRTFLGQFSRALGLNAWGLQKSVEDLDLDIVPQPQSSASALQQWAFTSGLPDGAGGYGPLVPTTASGGTATLTGVLGTVYANGLVATGPDGSTQIQLSGSVSIPGSGTGTGSISGARFVAVTAGSVGNLIAGSICTWASPPAGADPTFTLTSGLSGGNDFETNASIYSRTVQRWQAPPRGGNSTDIAEWSQAIAGVVGVYVYPRRSGTGTIDVVITVAASLTGQQGGAERVPSGALQTSVQAAVDAARAPGAESINILLPYLAASGHAIRVRVVPNGTVNAFDWGSDATWTGTPFTVDTGGYSAGPPATIRLNTLAPTSLKNAISAYIAGTGAQPRLQVMSTGAVINPPIGTSKTVTWSDAGGKTTITLDSLPTGWVAPSSGNAIYPYGPVVPTIASGILAYSNSIGPSRQSGYGDTFNSWLDILSINEIARVAEDAVDANGNVLVTQVLDGGATIDGAATSLEAADASVNNPELLFLSGIAVTP